MTDALISDSYHVGEFETLAEITKEQRDIWIGEITNLPGEFRTALEGLNDDQLDTPYREGGWTLRQVAHHVPDSHLNAFIRFKWALTEDFPTIKAYEEAEWAKLPDVENTPIETSLELLAALHRRWAVLLEKMRRADYRRAYLHPQAVPQKL